ncbi:MAG: CvpA family protein, partial [Lachnospiraceae bacterium]|nr:CvpA family protein [Lachnospiraceae bacterium]
MTINWLIILCIILLIWRIVEGFNRGMVKEIISCVSLIVLSIVAILAMTAFTRYMKKDILSMASAIIILLVVLLAHRILGIVFFSAKLVSKLPVIHSADKLLGAVV